MKRESLWVSYRLLAILKCTKSCNCFICSSNKEVSSPMICLAGLFSNSLDSDLRKLEKQTFRHKDMKRVDVICMIIIVKHGQIVFSFQIPKYILALHELLAHTPYEHVERRKLEYAKGKLEELSMVWFNIYMTSL